MNVNNENIVPQVITEFLEVAVHSILHARKVYPESIFIRNHKYGVVVYRSIHPQLNNYISECLKAAYHLIKANQVSKFVICFMRPHNIIEEQYIFDILSVKNIFITDPFLLQLEKNLRAFCLRLHSNIGYLSDLSSDISFTIQIHTTESGSVECMENPIFENFPWIDINLTDDSVFGSEIVPLQTIETDYLKLQSYIQTKLRN